MKRAALDAGSGSRLSALVKPISRMTPSELEREATRLLRASESRLTEEPDMGARPESWQLAPVSAIECECEDCDACEIARTFAEFSGERLAARFEAHAWMASDGKCETTRSYMREVRANDRLRSSHWRDRDRAVRRDPVLGGQLRQRDRRAKKRSRREPKACRDLFEGVVL